MARKKAESTPSAEAPEQPSAEVGQNLRGHDGRGNVRPADNRFELYDPEEGTDG